MSNETRNSHPPHIQLSNVGFIAANLDSVANKFQEWRTGPKVNHSLARRYISSSSLVELIKTLEPYVGGIPTKYLFVKGGAGSWTLFLDNRKNGTDVFPVTSYLARHLKTKGIRAANFSDDESCIIAFELYGPADTHFLNYERSICAAREGGKWQFINTGNPLLGENVDNYDKKRIKDRFSADDLMHVLGLFDINPYDELFYNSGGVVEGVLFERQSG